MSYTIKLEKAAEKVLKKWKKSNPQLFKKANSVFLELVEHPRTGPVHLSPPVQSNLWHDSVGI